MTAPVEAAMARVTRGCAIHERTRSMNSVTIETQTRSTSQRIHHRARTFAASDRSRKIPAKMSHMMMNGCGVGMMLVGGLGVLLGLTLLVSLIVLVWVVIGRLRREPLALPAGR